MYCSKCGADNLPDAAFCRNCGSPMSPGAQPSPQRSYDPTAPSPATGKSPLLAAILNLFFGVGYLYLGYRKVLGVPTFVFVIGVLVVYILLTFFFFGVLNLILAVIMAIDGYQKAEGQKGFISAEM